MHWQDSLVLLGASALGGAVNSVAGGGTLLTFPALLWSGHSAIVANATSTVALWPGQLGSLWGYRKEIGRSRKTIALLALPSLVGGSVGAILLLRTPAGTFAKLVPFLILTATVLFMVQEPLARYQRARAQKQSAGETETPIPAAEVTPSQQTLNVWLSLMGFQFMVAIYGGYFGAGIGILMLAALGFMGFANIHQMNGLKNINGLCINAVAAGLFIANRLVDWRIALLMATGAILGGYFGAGAARKIGQRNVRRIIIGIGFALTLSLLVQGMKSATKPVQPVPQQRKGTL